MKPAWSQEFPFAPQSIRRHTPVLPGVYEILQSSEYPRYAGSTRVLRIGMSKGNLRQELLNHLERHSVANRLARIRKRKELSLTFRFATAVPGEADSAEKQLLREFEDEHWDLPLLNSQRGYERGQDRSYKES